MPRLTDGQVIVGMARMVAILHDDETLLLPPQGAFFPLKLTWVGDPLCLVVAPDIVVGPTIRRLLAGVDPVLDTALSYGR